MQFKEKKQNKTKQYCLINKLVKIQSIMSPVFQIYIWHQGLLYLKDFKSKNMM